MVTNLFYFFQYVNVNYVADATEEDQNTTEFDSSEEEEEDEEKEGMESGDKFRNSNNFDSENDICYRNGIQKDKEDQI